MSTSRLPVPTGTEPGTGTATRTPAMLGASLVVALGILAATAYSLLASEPYRSLPEATVLAARGQDIASLLVAALLVVLVRPARLSVAAVGLLLLRGHRLGAPLALIALIKILTLFAALWAGPAYALATDGPVHLGPDAGPSLLLLAACAWLITAWWRALTTDTTRRTEQADEHPGGL